MKRSEYPDSCFAIVNKDKKIRLLAHHDPNCVNDGSEHSTVDPVMLSYALFVIDKIDFLSNKERELAKQHLKSHADVILWQDDTAGLPIALHDKMRDFAFFRVDLSGTAEVPPVTTNACGMAYCLLNKKTKEFSWFIQFENLSSNQVESHFHIGKSNVVGEVVIPVDNGSPMFGTTMLTDELVENLFNGNIYLNIHSINYPMGEIRGMVLPDAVSRSNNVWMNDKKKKKKKQENKKDTTTYSDDKSDGEQVKPPMEHKPKVHIRQNHMGVYSKVSISNLNDPNNVDLKNILNQNKMPNMKDKRPGEGNVNMHGGQVVQLLTDTNFGGRKIIFPSVGKVITVDVGEKIKESINNLPDSCFAAIERGEGKKSDNNYRHLPYKRKDGSIDLPSLRSSLSRVNNIKSNSKRDSTDRIRQVAKSRLVKSAIEYLSNSKFDQPKNSNKLSDIVNSIDVALCNALIVGEFEIAKAQLMEVEEVNSVKLLRIVMGDKDRPFDFFVKVITDGSGDVLSVIFDFDTHLPAMMAEDFAKFLRGLQVKKED